ncbi:MAG: DUF1648 domain-containing protein [Crenarchaeota archaeon]|nr:DUF1648 domain-containing protein [Thermoproteota archaeon]
MSVVDFAATLVAAVYMATGAALALAAGRLPPNPIVGARLGYAYASRSAWTRVNRVTGICLAVLGALILLVEYVYGGFAAILLFMAATPAILVLLSLYAERVAERLSIGEAAAVGRRVVEPRLPRILALPAAAGILVMVLAEAYTLLVYPMLPETMATHFNMAGVPDGFSSKESWLYVSAALSILVTGIDLYAVTAVALKPLLLYKPWYTPGDLRLAAAAFSLLALLISLITGYGIIDVTYYNLYGHHPLALTPLILILLACLAPLLGILAYLTAKATKRWLKGGRGGWRSWGRGV